MPAAIVSLLLGGLLMLLESIVGRILVALSVGVVTYTGLHASLDYFKSTFLTSIASTSSDIAGLLGTLKLDVCFSMFVSAALVKFAVNGMTSGSFSKFKVGK